MKRFLLWIIISAISSMPFLLAGGYPSHVRADNVTLQQQIVGVVKGNNPSRQVEVVSQPLPNVTLVDKLEPLSLTEMAEKQPVVFETPVVVAQASVPSDHTSLMQAAGIDPSDYQHVEYIVSHESGWNITSTNRSSGAYGLCQALPASKMASAGGDYMSNPVTQLRWCSGYASLRYGSWAAAYGAWVAQNWW